MTRPDPVFLVWAGGFTLLPLVMAAAIQLAPTCPWWASVLLVPIGPFMFWICYALNDGWGRPAMSLGYCEDCDAMVWTDRPIAWGVEHGLGHRAHRANTAWATLALH